MAKVKKPVVHQAATKSKKSPKAKGKPTVSQEDAASLEVKYPIVGIGASAGGLAAFEAFFSGMPAGVDPGMAFVLVQHLAPDHKSLLTEIIRRYTRMQVFEVEDGMVVKPNCTYIIPPNRDMALLNGKLQLLEPVAPHGHRLPIDFFFRSLAQDQREHAICIVLSGFGSDGTLGARAIKDEGGIVMVQSPESTEFDGMPGSVISTGLVDYALKPAEMPAQLIAYASHAFGKTPLLASVPESNTDTALKKIYILLRAQTGHDFSQYKPSTIQRRIERRMAVNQIETIDAYLQFLQSTPLELEALFRDLLIGVTNFFRDPEAFKVLEDEIVPALFAGKAPGSVIRVWSPGCSTGEEAYSIAILMQERLETLKQRYKIQVFATDIDSRAIATARAGLYPASIAADISPERLARFFAVEADGSSYRIQKSIRDLLIFSEQDVVKDPPFSKIDLISCRNLMIYMSGDLQRKLLPMFHYALNPNAFLFLGNSETVGEFGDLFTALNRKLKLYKRQEGIFSTQHPALHRFSQASSNIDEPLCRFTEKPTSSRKPSLRELTEQALLRQVAPTAALVNSQGDILYLHGRTGRYLEPAPGEAGINNILRMAREGLRHDLTTALHKVVSDQKIIRHQAPLVKNNGDFIPVNLTVCQVEVDSTATANPSLYLITLEEAAPGEPAEAKQTAWSGSAGQDSANPLDATASITALKQELHAQEEFLQASNEELKSSNEEMQSMNEELQSTNEELETSKEELQSINEELATVNAEMQTKVVELTRLNNDMNNLLAGTGIATVFVDHQQRILSFTPTASQIVNLISSDVGRPIGHFVSNLVGYDCLVADVKSVLNTLIPVEREVQTTVGEWYMMRILPYRTTDNVIEGAVLTFVNVTDWKELQHQAFEANADLGTKVRERTLSLQQSMAQLRRVARELTQTEQRERQRLATFIHDGMQQILVAASLRLERLSNSEQSAEKQQALQQVEKLLLQAVDATRSLTIELKPPVLNSGNLVKSLQWLADWLWNRFDFTLRFSMPEDFQAEGIPADDIAFLFDTVRELCFNIVKHAHVKEGRMTLERVAENRLLLSIEDDGAGVGLVSDNLPESANGGLGLRAIQDRMSLIGGEMHVTSAVGKGFRVEISLPYTSISVTRRQQLFTGKAKLKASKQQADSLPKEQKIRVMLVDDHVVVRDGLKMILAEEPDIDVIGEAGDGEKALKLAAKLHPDVVIMDVNMPRMDGIEATKLLKQAHPEICIIALSINDDQGITNDMLDAGACAYLNKSGSADDVCAVIRACQQAKPTTVILQDGEGGDDAS